MNLSQPFIERPVATTLLTIGVGLAGAVAFGLLPVSPLPQIDFPTISVSAGLPGASPEIMASSVATPLERQFTRIAGVTEMTSSSSLGQTGITLQFDLSRNIDAAARDVEAAINAARAYLPADLPINPSYHKVNPADAPIMIIALTSDKLPPSALYDAASTILMQRISQIRGVGQVFAGGSSAPAVRIDVNPTQINSYGIQLENIRTAIASQTVNLAKGSFSDANKSWLIGANDQLMRAKDYRPLIVSYRQPAAVKLSDVANVTDSVQTVRSLGIANGKRSALLIIYRQPGANIIATVDAIKAALPNLHASVNRAIDMTITLDQTVTIRASVRDVERTLFISICLVVLVVFLFLRDVRSTLIPSVAVPVSLIGTCGVMYLLGYSIDNLSLMALTISTGFVVDDAIVVLENITRYREHGMSAMEAALRGAKEIGPTVLSISISLVAVFIPILLMGGIIGRLFREFAVTLSVTILVSLLVSLTTTPMMSSRLLSDEKRHGRLYRASEKVFEWILKGYEHSLAWVLRNSALVLLIAIATLCLNIYLYIIVPKGFFPQQDTGRIAGSFLGDQSTSFQSMSAKIAALCKVVQADPGVATIQAFSGGGGGTTINTGRTFIALKPLNERKATADQIIARLRPKLNSIPGVTLYLQATQDLRIGGRQSAAQYQYTLQSDTLTELIHWAPLLTNLMKRMPELTDVNSDQQNNGLEANLVIDRPTAARLGITPQTIDNVLYDAFGEREVARTYSSMNQYFVVIEVNPEFWQNPDGLREIYVNSSAGRPVPLAAFTHFQPATAALAVTHSGVFPSVTISFNLAPNVSLGQAVQAIKAVEQKAGMPTTITTNFSGTAQAFQSSLANEPMLIAAALAAVYIVLGILYESYIHPITILSTLPSAGVGAILALMITHTDLSVIALIGIILLIGIVKKNAIMMIDFALEVERRGHKTSKEAVFEACLLRFRPIMMTTMAALLGGLPLALGTGTGSELRRPLGITIVGGLIVSQALTLFTTPVIYLYMDRFSLWLSRLRGRLPEAPVEAVEPAG
ncbi:MAG: multidrug efflux RND transporter permease subunit [Acidobacteriaceae bacterium]|nr:multidrug efflux RND transporter permease subunit [Acidobacteriaceae bacterium]MBV9780024.1 multidrug efflux RND transporter permease subunit [Acidobacteriaceae bacterium]